MSIEALQQSRSTPVEAEMTARMSSRYRQVFAELLLGLSEKQIASRIGLKPHTIHAYVKQVYRLRGVNSRAELLAQVIERYRIAAAGDFGSTTPESSDALTSVNSSLRTKPTARRAPTSSR